MINGRPGSRLLRPPARRPTPSVQVRSRPAPQESCDPERLEKASGWTRMDRRVKFLQSAAKSVSPPRLLSQSSAWGESSEPCRTSSTDRRVVALPHPRWQGTTERFAPLISRWCRPPVVTLPNPQPGSRARGARRGGQNPRSGHGWNIATTHLDLLRPNLRVAPAGITSSLACLNWSVALEPALSLFVGSTAKAVATGG